MSDPIIRRIHACVLAGVPVCLWGEPGTGKTARTLQYGRARGLHLERWLLSRCEPIDLKPRIYDGGKMIVADPPEIDRLKERGGILFLDELNRAARETEGAALDRIDAPPPGVSVIAACNPPSRGQAARALESAAANRFCHLDVQADAIAWANAQVGGWADDDAILTVPDEAALKRATARAATLVSAFIRRRGELLEKAPDNTVHAGKAWPSTRTWEYARKLHAMAMALGYDAEDTRSLIAGCVGDGPAVEFLAYVADADLPDPEELLAKPETFAPSPGRVDRTVAALTAVVGAVDQAFTEPRWTAAWQIIATCVNSDQADAAMTGGDMLMAAYRRFGKRDAKAQTALTNPVKLMTRRMAEIIAS